MAATPACSARSISACSVQDYRRQRSAWKVDVPHPLRDKLEQVDAEIHQMLKEAHMDN